MGTVFSLSRHGNLNTVTVYGASGLGCLRLRSRGRTIEGQDGCGTLEVEARTQKVDYRLS